MEILEISPVFPPCVGGVRKDVRRALKYSISMLLGMICGMPDYLTDVKIYCLERIHGMIAHMI